MNLQEIVSKAEEKENPSKLPRDVLEIPGFTDDRIRHFLNLLCEGKNYVECGTLLGATALAASYGNEGSFISIDNFSQWKSKGDLPYGLGGTEW